MCGGVNAFSIVETGSAESKTDVCCTFFLRVEVCTTGMDVFYAVFYGPLL